MTRAEAEQALEIARNALREVGEDPESIWIDGHGDGCDIVGQGLATPQGYRAVALAASVVRPGDKPHCYRHLVNWGDISECERVTVADALAGRLSCEAVTA